MSQHAYAIRSSLFSGIMSARQLSEKIGVSQPTISRGLADLGNEIVRIGVARSIQYALRDASRGLPDISVYRVGTEGAIKKTWYAYSCASRWICNVSGRRQNIA